MYYYIECYDSKDQYLVTPYSLRHWNKSYKATTWYAQLLALKQTKTNIAYIRIITYIDNKPEILETIKTGGHLK